MNKRRLMICISLLLLFLLSGCSRQAKNTTPVVATVNEEEIHMDEMMYYIYEAELTGNANEEMYQTFFGESYWDMTDDSGTTYRDLAKTETMDKALLYEIFYQRAIQSGYELKEEELAQVREDAKEIYDSLTAKQRDTMEMDEERLAEIFEKIEIVNTYYADFVNGLDVDEAVATSGIYEEDYQEYLVEYLFVPTTYYAENPEDADCDDADDCGLIPYSEEDRQAARERIEGYLKKAKEDDMKSKEFADLVSEDDDVTEVSEATFLEGDEIFGAKFEKAALKLKDGEITDQIVEEEDGYYLIRMIDTDSKESYQTAMDNAVETAKDEAFQKAYETIKKEYKTVVMDDIWSPIVIGDITYDKEAATSEKAVEDGLSITE